RLYPDSLFSQPLLYALLASSLVFFFVLPPPPRSTLFPYTTLFRSRPRVRDHGLREPVHHRRRRQRDRRRGRLPDTERPEFGDRGDRKSTRLNSSHVKISYAVFCLKKKKKKKTTTLHSRQRLRNNAA